MVFFKGRHMAAHRVAFMLAHQCDPGRQFVLHDCDNPPCCNPSHLKLGSHKDNMADMVRRGRAATGERNATHLYPEKYRGEKNGRAKLNSEQVAAIRATFAAGNSSHGDLAQAYGVTRTMIGYIVRGDAWSANRSIHTKRRRVVIPPDELCQLASAYYRGLATQRELARLVGVSDATMWRRLHAVSSTASLS